MLNILRRYAFCMSPRQHLRSLASIKRPQISKLVKSKLLLLNEFLQLDASNDMDIQWQTLRSDLMSNIKSTSELNVDSMILGHLASENQLQNAKKYIKFLKNSNLELNYAIIGQIMKIYYMLHKDGVLTEKEQNDIMNTYRNLRKDHQVLDPTTCENIITGLITTDNWMESIELLDMIKLVGKPGAMTYGIMIDRAFQNEKDFPLGWKLLHEAVSFEKQPQSEIFISYFNTIKQNQKSFSDRAGIMFKFLEDNNLQVSRDVINHLTKIFEELKVEFSVTKISTQGKCFNCNSQMKSVKLSLSEFKLLRSNFLEKVLIRDDLFRRSTPEEVDKFKKFLNNTKPFDCIVDGLNVGFSAGPKKSNSTYAKLLASVVRYFVERKKRVLILGRSHMKAWPRNQLNYITRHSLLYLTDNLTADDPLLLYAALESGPSTDFFSRDLMRSHAHLLGPELKPIFRKWQQEHQYSLITTLGDDRILVKDPLKYCTYAHKANSTWHIPFKEEYSSNPGYTFEFPKSWLCVKI